MCHNKRLLSQIATIPKQKGSTLVIAIFIIIVMTLLGVALMKTLSTTAQSVAYEVLGTRAYQAGQTGLQWQLQRTFPITGSPQCSATATEITLTNTNGLTQCKFNVTCIENQYDGVNYYQITSLGECNDTTVITTREFVVEARDLDN